MGAHYLDRLFNPRSVAVFGASHEQDSVGARLFTNLTVEGTSIPVYAVNPKHQSIGETKCYASIQEVAERVDLAVIATPADTVPQIIRDCGEHGVRAACVVSGGFHASQGRGSSLRRAVMSEARRYQMRVLGPNCLGLMRPGSGLNATFSNNTARPGALALVSQSGGLCTAILDWAAHRKVGFSAVVSLGDAVDVDFGDVLDYLALDAQTRGILVYVEGIGNARTFVSGLRVAARLKPVVVVKAGRHLEGSRAVMSHTGALVGADDVFDAALQRAGAVRAMTIEQLFAAAEVLDSRHRVRGNRLGIVTNGGGPGVMATDRAADLGVALAALEPATLARLDALLPAHWSHGNPVDILGDATSERYEGAVTACLEDPLVDGVLVMLTPQAMSRPTQSAEAVIRAARTSDKPVLACWMGESQVTEARRLLDENGVPSFASPEVSVEAFAYLASYRLNQQLLLQVPGPLARHGGSDVTGARMIIEGALGEHRKVLTGLEARAVLRAFGVPVMPLLEAGSANEALVAAQSLGLPVALKINSPDISHKSDVNGVRLNVGHAEAVRAAYNDLLSNVQKERPEADIKGVTVERMYTGAHGRELMVGVIRDAVFGPVISFGAGGTAVEVLRDRAVALPPLNEFISRSMIERTRVSRLLDAYRNQPPVKQDALHRVLSRVSEMVCELPEIRELDINPLMADEDGVVALDARIVVDYEGRASERYAHMAIHPYPTHLVQPWQLADGTTVTIRPIRPEDAEIEQAFVRNLSPQAKYFRFMQTLQELSPPMLVRFTQIDYDREMALIAVVSEHGVETEIAVARYSTNPDGESCEFALVVADAWQKRGIGSRLMSSLIDIARTRGFKSMDGEVLATNLGMLALVTKLGFDIRASDDDAKLRVVTRAL